MKSTSMIFVESDQGERVSRLKALTAVAGFSQGNSL